jgi:hypothetical protein
MYICMYAYLYVCMCVCMCVCMRVYIGNQSSEEDAGDGSVSRGRRRSDSTDQRAYQCTCRMYVDTYTYI